MLLTKLPLPLSWISKQSNINYIHYIASYISLIMAWPYWLTTNFILAERHILLPVTIRFWWEQYEATIWCTITYHLKCYALWSNRSVSNSGKGALSFPLIIHMRNVNFLFTFFSWRIWWKIIVGAIRLYRYININSAHGNKIFTPNIFPPECYESILLIRIASHVVFCWPFADGIGMSMNPDGVFK